MCSMINVKYFKHNLKAIAKNFDCGNIITCDKMPTRCYKYDEKLGTNVDQHFADNKGVVFGSKYRKKPQKLHHMLA